MKNLLRFLAALLCVAGVSMAVVSCSKDEQDPLEIKSVNVEYCLSLSPAFYDFYDVSVSYLDEREKRHVLQVVEDWNYGFSVKPENAPYDYRYEVTATPKAVHPDFNESRYTLSCNVRADFFCFRYDGSVFKELSSDYCKTSQSNTDELVMRPDEFKTYFEKGERSLLNFVKTVDGNY